MTKTKYEKVKEFHESFNISMPISPTTLDKEALLNRMDFITEEVIEAIHAVSDNKTEFELLYWRLLERMENSFEKQYEKPIPEDKLTSLADAFTDISYFNNGNFTLINVDPDPLFDIVHNANMGKLFSDGKPRYTEVGKIIKPDDWKEKYAPEPLLEAEIQRQIEAAKQ